jgi:hypothetical protein
MIASTHGAMTLSAEAVLTGKCLGAGQIAMSLRAVLSNWSIRCIGRFSVPHRFKKRMAPNIGLTEIDCRHHEKSLVVLSNESALNVGILSMAKKPRA